MNTVCRVLGWLDAHWHTYICPLAARVDRDDDGWQTCPTCDGGGAIPNGEVE